MLAAWRGPWLGMGCMKHSVHGTQWHLHVEGGSTLAVGDAGDSQRGLSIASQEQEGRRRWAPSRKGAAALWQQQGSQPSRLGHQQLWQWEQRSMPVFG